MPREWCGSVFPSKRREKTAAEPTGSDLAPVEPTIIHLDTFSAKWKEFGTERWRITKGFATKADANDYLAKKRREYRDRRRGEFDEFAEQRKRPLTEHIEDFHAHLLANRKRRSGKRTEKHANQSRQRLRDAIKAMGAKTIADLGGSKVDRFLGNLLDLHGRAMKTRNDYCAVLKQFAKWAAADGRIEHDPLGNVRFIENVGGAKKKQTLTWQQVRDLAAACVQRPAQRAPRKTREEAIENGRRRGLAVVIMFLTGLRNNEVASLRWEWIDFASFVVTLPHDVTKSARTERVPLHAGLAELLTHEKKRRAVVGGAPVAASDLVVGEIVNGEPKLPRHVNERLRDDAKWIKHPVVDERGRVLSIYSMRTSFATQLAELGVPDGTVSELMRHRPGDVTQQHYVQRSLAMLRQAVDIIPAVAAHVPGLVGEPRRAPNHVRDSEDGCAPDNKTSAG